jgi:putative ABC transport system substrate-binding protein
VFGVVTDPVGIGLVASLVRPGGNVTGLANSVADALLAKRIELQREIVPGVKRIGLLGDSTDPLVKRAPQALAPLAARLGLALTFAEATNPAEFETAVAGLLADRVEAIVQLGQSP